MAGRRRANHHGFQHLPQMDVPRTAGFDYGFGFPSPYHQMYGRGPVDVPGGNEVVAAFQPYIHRSQAAPSPEPGVGAVGNYGPPEESFGTPQQVVPSADCTFSSGTSDLAVCNPSDYTYGRDQNSLAPPMYDPVNFDYSGGNVGMRMMPPVHDGSPPECRQTSLLGPHPLSVSPCGYVVTINPVYAIPDAHAQGTTFEQWQNQAPVASPEMPHSYHPHRRQLSFQRGRNSHRRNQRHGPSPHIPRLQNLSAATSSASGADIPPNPSPPDGPAYVVPLRRENLEKHNRANWNGRYRRMPTRQGRFQASNSQENNGPGRETRGKLAVAVSAAEAEPSSRSEWLSGGCRVAGGQGKGSDLQIVKYCPFCFNNGETPLIYTTHNLKEGNIIACPMLRRHMCSLCGATGDNAHTTQHCPKLNEEGEPGEEGQEEEEQRMEQ